MTDFDYDIREKKSIARSASHKKCGSKSRKCTLSSDYLTPAQIRKLSGRSYSMNLGKPMTWEVFKDLSDSLRSIYIEELVKRFDVTASRIAAMLGVSAETLNTCLKESGCKTTFKRGHKMTAENIKAWDCFCGIETDENDSCETTATESQNEQHEINDEQEEMKMEEFTIRFCGKIDYQNILNTLRLMLGTNATSCEMSITCGEICYGAKTACGFNT